MNHEAGSGALSESGWEHFDHGADIGVRGFAPSLEAAFAQAAVALTAVVTDPELVHGNQRVVVDCEAPDSEMLLMTWLNAVISQMGIRQMLFRRYQVAIHSRADRLSLHGELFGEAVDPDRHQPAVEVKGATATELRVFRDSRARWVAQCIVDV
jgi:tRNA nucleotidyltransferase (CCA-adding enzyme)